MSRKKSSADEYLENFVANLYKELTKNFQDFIKERPFTEEEDNLLQSLDDESPKYKMFLSILAIDTYMKHAIHLVRSCEPFVETMSLLLSGLVSVRRELDETAVSPAIFEAFDCLWKDLTDACFKSHKLFPNSSMINIQRELIENNFLFDPKQTIYARLSEENEDLKEKIKFSDQVIAELELKLAKFVDEKESRENVLPTMKILELKEELEEKDRIIKEMDEEFSEQITKYNVVYEAMKEEIANLMSTKDIKVTDYLEQLEIDFVKLREKSARDHILIKELKAEIYQPEIYQKSSFEQSLAGRNNTYY